MLFGCLHQLEEVLVMVLRGMAIDTYIVVYCVNVGVTVYCLVHSHLKDTQGHCHTKKAYAGTCICNDKFKYGQIQRFLISVDAPEAILGV